MAGQGGAVAQGSGSEKSVCIAVDAHGGDNAPSAVLNGVASALENDANLKVLLVGFEDEIAAFCGDHERALALPCTEVIGMDEHPAKAVRSKRDSSIVRGCKAVRAQEADGFFSAGSTGACLAAALMHVGRAGGVERPAIATCMPATSGKGTVLLDVGANADCKPEYLVQFAKMGVIYAECALGIDAPRVGLLNIGAEDSKGSAFAQEAHALLREGIPQFAGNAEGPDLLNGRFDVIVTDGFTGNVALKSCEGTAKALLKEISSVLHETVVTKLAGAMVKPKLKALAKRMGPDSTGAAPLLGVRAPVFIGHGSSSANAIENGIETTAAAVRAGLVDRIASSMAQETPNALS